MSFKAHEITKSCEVVCNVSYCQFIVRSFKIVKELSIQNPSFLFLCTTRSCLEDSIANRFRIVRLTKSSFAEFGIWWMRNFLHKHLKQLLSSTFLRSDCRTRAFLLKFLAIHFSRLFSKIFYESLFFGINIDLCSVTCKTWLNHFCWPMSLQIKLRTPRRI